VPQCRVPSGLRIDRPALTPPARLFKFKFQDLSLTSPKWHIKKQCVTYEHFLQYLGGDPGSFFLNES
jgi:hypothetical protein